MTKNISNQFLMETKERQVVYMTISNHTLIIEVAKEEVSA